MIIVTIISIAAIIVFAYLLGHKHGADEVEDQYRSGDRKSD